MNEISPMMWWNVSVWFLTGKQNVIVLVGEKCMGEQRMGLELTVTVSGLVLLIDQDTFMNSGTIKS
jgi:hypothetical protein